MIKTWLSLMTFALFVPTSSAMAEADFDVAFENTIAITSGGQFGKGGVTKYFYNPDQTVTIVDKKNVYRGTWEYTTLKDGSRGHCTYIPEHENKYNREICGPIGENTEVGATWEYKPFFALTLTGEIVPGRNGEPQDVAQAESE